MTFAPTPITEPDILTRALGFLEPLVLQSTQVQFRPRPVRSKTSVGESLSGKRATWNLKASGVPDFTNKLLSSSFSKRTQSMRSAPSLRLLMTFRTAASAPGALFAPETAADLAPAPTTLNLTGLETKDSWI